MARDSVFTRVVRIISNLRTSNNDPLLDISIGEIEQPTETNSASLGVSDLEKRLCALLEVPISSSMAEKRQAYRRMCLRYHPDNFVADETRLTAANELMIQLNDAMRYFEERAKSHEIS